MIKTALSFGLLAAFAVGYGQSHNMPCPMMQADKHAKGVDTRGDKAMGFNHDASRHHFRLFSDGGSIDVITKGKDDKAQLTAIRSHLEMIAGMFSAGDFHLPMFIHDRVVPGQQTMQSHRDLILYTYDLLPEGGRVRITTTDAQSLAAVHKFLAFQVKDHRTGDSAKVEKP